MRVSSPRLGTCSQNSSLYSNLKWPPRLEICPHHPFYQPELPGACLGCREGAGLIYGLANLPGEREGASDPRGKSWTSPGPVSSPGKKPWAFVISMFPLRG